MSSDFATTLEQCLSQVESSRARVESCRVSYPTLAQELEPLLRTAEALRAAPRPVLSREAEARISALVFGKPKPAPLPRRRTQARSLPRLSRSWAFAGLGAVLIVALLSTTGLAYAASDALPGSALYPAKVATEAAWLWITPARAEAALHLRLAERRLGEIEALADQGVVEPEPLARLAWHVDMALKAAQGMPQEQALPLLETIVALTGREQETLARLLSQVPAGERGHLQQALLVCREQGRLALAATGAGQPWPGPNGELPPGQMHVPPGQGVRPEWKDTPPGQEQVPPGLDKPADGTEGDDEEKEADKEEKEADKEEKEAEKEAAEEEKEAEKEAAEEEKEEEKEAAEEEKEADKEAAEEEKEAAEEEREAEKEAAEEEKEAVEDEKEEEQDEAEEEKEEIEEEQEDKGQKEDGDKKDKEENDK